MDDVGQRGSRVHWVRAAAKLLDVVSNEGAVETAIVNVTQTARRGQKCVGGGREDGDNELVSLIETNMRVDQRSTVAPCLSGQNPGERCG